MSSLSRNCQQGVTWETPWNTGKYTIYKTVDRELAAPGGYQTDGLPVIVINLW